MFKLFRFTAGLLCLGGLALGVLAYNPAGRFVSSLSGNSANKLSLVEELERKEQFDQYEKALRRRREAKWRLAEEVIDGRLKLAEAMERFQALDHGWLPGRVQRAETLGISEDEVDGQAVLIHVRFVLLSRQEKPDAILDSLKKELQELLANRPQQPAVPLDREPSKPGS